MSVYFITCREQGICKIGKAKNPKARRSSLQTAFPTRLVLEGTLPGGVALERKLHQRFAKFRLSGEWFRLNDKLEEAIQSAASSPALPIEEPSSPPPLADLCSEELVERSLKAARGMLVEHERIFEKLAPSTVLDLPPSRRFFRPVAASGGQFNRQFCIRDGDGRQLCADMGLTWDQADHLCDVLEGVRQRSLTLPMPQPEERAA
jgi:hypothetical protein